MLRLTTLCLILLGLTLSAARAQSTLPERDRYYFTSGGEMNFSFARVDFMGEQPTILRWAPVFNPQVLYHMDYNRQLGFFVGAGIQNVGFIMDRPDEENVRNKFRTYNAGIPIGLKVGNMDGSFLYGGLSLEFPFNYKEKRFENGDKVDKLVVWFSNRTQNFQVAPFLGYQWRSSISLKFKYYLTEFFNQGFVDGSGMRPYQGFRANVFYFALSFRLFRDKKFIQPATRPQRSEI